MAQLNSIMSLQISSSFQSRFKSFRHLELLYCKYLRRFKFRTLNKNFGLLLCFFCPKLKSFENFATKNHITQNSRDKFISRFSGSHIYFVTLTYKFRDFAKILHYNHFNFVLLSNTKRIFLANSNKRIPCEVFLVPKGNE